MMTDGCEAKTATPTGIETESEIQAWQERCAIVEGALAAANNLLQLELPRWQQRSASVEAALAEANKHGATVEAALAEANKHGAMVEAALAEANRHGAIVEAALADTTRRLSEEIPQWRHRCELAEIALAAMQESRKGRSVPFTDTYAFLAFAANFTPAQTIGVTKRRIGAAADGGYVMLGDVADPSLALSLGVGDDTSWDRCMLNLGALVHQYDHTVEPPEQSPQIVFHAKQIVDVADGFGVTLEDALRSLEAGDHEKPAILKMDIEGSEWPVLDTVPDAVLQRFDQIVCEYHDFGKAADPDWFERASRVAAKLNRYFQVVHVHGNNAEPMVVVGGVPFPCVLEVTYANRRRYQFTRNTEIFPTELDAANHPGRPDLWLGSFSFDSDSSRHGQKVPSDLEL